MAQNFCQKARNFAVFQGIIEIFKSGHPSGSHFEEMEAQI
jgi:hypothetical protein